VLPCSNWCASTDRPVQRSFGQNFGLPRAALCALARIAYYEAGAGFDGELSKFGAKNEAMLREPIALAVACGSEGML
jgi:hypothetical protein